MKIRFAALFFASLVAVWAPAQTPSLAAYQNFCAVGGQKAMVQGAASSNTIQTSYPKCSVSVYLTGTQTRATIFKDSNSTPLGNPFTANADASFLFFSGTGQGYDIVLSGGTPTPLPQPFTYTDVLLGGGGGSSASIAPTTTFLKGVSAGGQGVQALPADLATFLSSLTPCQDSTKAYSPGAGTCIPVGGSSAISGNVYTVSMFDATGKALANSNLTQNVTTGADSFSAAVGGPYTTFDDGSGFMGQSCSGPKYNSVSVNPSTLNCGVRAVSMDLSGFYNAPGNQAGFYGWTSNFIEHGSGIRGMYSDVGSCLGMEGDCNMFDRAVSFRGAASNAADENMHLFREQVSETSPWSNAAVGAFFRDPAGQYGVVAVGQPFNVGNLGQGGPVIDLSTEVDIAVTSISGGTLQTSSTLTPSTNGTLAASVILQGPYTYANGPNPAPSVNIIYAGSSPVGLDCVIYGSSQPEKIVPSSATAVSGGWHITASMTKTHYGGDSISCGGTFTGRYLQVEPLPTPTVPLESAPTVQVADRHLAMVLATGTHSLQTGFADHGATGAGYLGGAGTYAVMNGALVTDVRDTRSVSDGGPAVTSSYTGYYFQFGPSATWNAQSGDILEQPNPVNEFFDLDHWLLYLVNQHVPVILHSYALPGGLPPISGQANFYNFASGGGLVDSYWQGGFGAGIISDTPPRGGSTQNSMNGVPAYLGTGAVATSATPFWIDALQFTENTASSDDVAFGGLELVPSLHRYSLLGTDFIHSISIAEDAQAGCHDGSCGAYAILEDFEGPTPGFGGTKYTDGHVFQGRDGYVRTDQTYTVNGLNAAYASDGNPITANLTTNFAKQLHGLGYSISCNDADAQHCFVFERGSGNLELNNGSVIVSSGDGHHWKLNVSTSGAVSASQYN